VVPREEHGLQKRSEFRVAVSDESAEVTIGNDAYINCIVNIRVPFVTSRIDFSAWSLVSRRPDAPAIEPRQLLAADHLLCPTPLTQADALLTEVARDLAASTHHPVAIGEKACEWVRRMMKYEYGVTNVRTTAGNAVSGGRGVCQDFAHVMLAICRAASVPARYVSGHLIGEGGSHAWVEILHPDSAGRGAVAVGFDPTHDRLVDHRYLAIAVGRDYLDVAPTSGTFTGRGRGRLHVTKRLRALSDEDDIPRPQSIVS
jgi:transglutaminase-like putative cysteine protease